MWIILPVMLALNDSQVVSPLQLCTGTAIHLDRRYNMRATGDARCSVGDILLQGEDATVTTNSDERVLDVVMTGKRAHSVVVTESAAIASQPEWNELAAPGSWRG